MLMDCYGTLDSRGVRREATRPSIDPAKVAMMLLIRSSAEESRVGRNT